MKITIVTIVVIITSFQLAFSQQLKPNSIVKAKHTSFKITTANISHGRMFVENGDNALTDRKPNQSYQLSETRALNIVSSFKKVFSESRLNELLNEPNMTLKYYLSAEGKVLEVSFLLKPNTLVTATELEALETTIKSNVSFKVRKEHANVGGFFNVFQNITFSKILDGTQP